MDRTESIGKPSARLQFAAAWLTNQEFASVQLEVHALLQEAMALQEEASALSIGPSSAGDQLARRTTLARQASYCCMRASIACARLAIGERLQRIM